MICSKCNASIPDNSVFCQVCGKELRENTTMHKQQEDPFSVLGDFDVENQSADSEIRDDHVMGASNSGARTRVYDVAEDGLWYDQAVDHAGEAIPADSPKQNTRICASCGKPTLVDSTFCEHCGKQLGQVSTKKKSPWVKWGTFVACWAVFFLIAALLSGNNMAGGSNGGGEQYAPPLSDTCDYVLCQGTDTDGNVYELVANQTESAKGFEIEVGVIKNNEWLYPLSADFPFLSKNGLFNVPIPLYSFSPSSLSNPNVVINSLYFIDSGAFLMERYMVNSSLFESDYTNYVVFSCDTMQTYTIDCRTVELMYSGNEPQFERGNLVSYGYMSSDDGKLLMYSHKAKEGYDWYTLDTHSLTVKTIASNMVIRPRGALAEGMIFASDDCFYDVNMRKVIDLSEYNVVSSLVYFQNGTCTFTAKNELGTKFKITIDKSGNVISEVKSN